MTVEHDPTTGRLRLDRRSFDTLVATLDGAGSEPAQAELVRAGVLDADGRPAEHLLPALETAVRPWVAMTVDQVESDGRSWHADVWVGPEVATFLLGSADGDPGSLAELVVTSVGHLPYGLARLVGLGVRAATDTDPWELPAAKLADLLDPARRDALLLDERGAVPESLRTQTWRYWAVRSRWERPGAELDGRSLHATDRSAGPLLMTLDDQEGRIRWKPTTTVALWKLLSLLLPDDGELAQSPPRHRSDLST